MSTPRSILAAVGVLSLLTFGAACGDDDDAGSTATEADGGAEGESEFAAYCTMIDEFENAEEFPSDEQLDELASIAPEEIRDDVTALVEGLKSEEELSEEDQSALGEAEARVTAWEEENCATDEATDSEETTGAESTAEEG